MRILQICQKPPFPAVDGGCIAMNQLSELIVEDGHELTVLAMETYKHPRLEDSSSDKWTRKTGMETLFVDIKVNLVTAFFNLFSSESYNIQRFHNLKFKKKVEDIVADNGIDLVIFESLFTTPYLETVKNNAGIKTIYRAHNIEHEIWKHHISNQRNPILKWYFKLLYKKLKRYELEVIPQFDAIATLSNHDKEFVESIKDVKRLQNVSVYYPYNDSTPGKVESGTIRFFHIGSMDWKPNQEGIKWFLENVWSAISVKGKQSVKLFLAGRSMPGWLKTLKSEGVEILGEIEDAEKFIEENDIMIVPLFSASGIRVKMIEAMGKNKAILCTSVAAKGIEYEAGKNILIADSAEEFIQVIQEIASGNIDFKEVGRTGGALISKYHNKNLAKEQLRLLINEFSVLDK